MTHTTRTHAHVHPCPSHSWPRQQAPCPPQFHSVLPAVPQAHLDRHQLRECTARVSVAQGWDGGAQAAAGHRADERTSRSHGNPHPPPTSALCVKETTRERVSTSQRGCNCNHTLGDFWRDGRQQHLKQRDAKFRIGSEIASYFGKSRSFRSDDLNKRLRHSAAAWRLTSDLGACSAHQPASWRTWSGRGSRLPG